MSVRHAVLGLLAEEPRHPYELKRAFDERVGSFWAVNYGQIYQTVDRLECEGLIEGSEVAQRKRPDKRIFEVTARGREEFRRWLHTPKAKARPLRDEFLVKLLFADLDQPEEVLEVVEQQEEIYLEKMRTLTARKRMLQRSTEDRAGVAPRLLVEAALFHAEADLRWLEHVRLTLNKRSSKSQASRNGGSE